MSTEHTESVAQYGDDGHGAGSIAAPAQVVEGNGSQPQANNSSTSGRRRRRRRKGKSAGAATAQGVAGEGSAGEGSTAIPQSQPLAQGSAPAAAQAGGPVQPVTANGFSPAQGQNSGQGYSQSQGGGKRKNRKRTHGTNGGAAGNGASGGGATNGFAPNGSASNGSGANGSAGNSGSSSQPASAGQNGNGQSRSRQNRTNGGWKARNNEGPDGNREGARGGFGSEAFIDNIGNGGGMRRKGKFGRNGGGGGPRSFVGPMDHSYRMVNGNIADGPPSTMDYRNANGNANGNVNGRNDMTDFEPAAALREDAPTRIVCFIEDLFVVAKMQETARKLGVKVQFAKAEKEALAAITDPPEGERPSLIVFDLNNAAAKPLTLIPKLKAKLKRGTSIIGFLQHIQGDLKMKAMEAGCDSVMPRAAFSQNLPNLLRRHGFAEEEEMMEA
jgi:hypothetical protein